MRKAIFAAMLAIPLIFTPIAAARPMVECPDTNTHVWDADQCSRLKPKESGGSGGGCGSALNCAVGGLLGTLGL